MKRLTIGGLALLLLVADCTTTNETYNWTPKTVQFERDSINLHPVPSKMEEFEGQTPGSGSYILPDGSYFDMSGGGSAGNLTLILTQNDGTDVSAKQAQTTDANVAPSAAANVTSPNANATATPTVEETDTETGTPEVTDAPVEPGQ